MEYSYGDYVMRAESLDAPDMVNSPPHYAETRIECLDAIEAMVERWPGEAGYLGGNIVKYVWRHRQKAPVESLRKARFYLDRLIALAEAHRVPDDALRSHDKKNL